MKWTGKTGNEPKGCPSMFLGIINLEWRSTKQRKRTDRGKWNTKTKGNMKPLFSGIVKVKVTKPWQITHLELKVKTNVFSGNFWLQVLETEIGNGSVAPLSPWSCMKTMSAAQISSVGWSSQFEPFMCLVGENQNMPDVKNTTFGWWGWFIEA